MPQDKGLYMPVTIPRLDDKFLNHLDEYSLPEIAFYVAKNLLGDDIPADDLKYFWCFRVLGKGKVLCG